MALPTEKQKPTLQVQSSKTLLYGPPGAGKTTLASSLYPESTVIAATEPGTGGIEAFVQPIGSWEEFREFGGDLAKGEHPFSTVVIDTTDELFRFCQDYVQRQHKIVHPSDLDYGKGWTLLADEFRLRVGKLCSLGMGVIFISHATEREVEQRVGKITKTVPTLTGQAGKFLLGFVDFIFLYRMEGSGTGAQRVLRTKGSENWEAKQRRVPGVDPLPDPLILPEDEVNPSSAASALLEALASRNGKVAAGAK